MHRYAITISVIGFLSFTSLPAAPALAAPPDGTQLKVTVTSVVGLAQKRLSDDPQGKWQALKVNDILSDKTIIRTGLGAKVVLKAENRGLITIKSGTKAGIDTLIQRGTLVTARLGLKYGSMRARMDPAAGQNDFRLTTAVATLSTRGCGINSAFSGDFGFFAKSFESIWDANTPSGGTQIGEGQSTDGDLTPSHRIAGRNRSTQMGDIHGGLTEIETLNLQLFGSGRGIFGFNGAGSTGTGLFSRSSSSSSPDPGENGYNQVDDPPYRPGYDIFTNTNAEN